MVKSHEFISKTVLKNFAVKEGGRFYVHYIAFPSNTINREDIEILNTRAGAYTSDNEVALSQDFESHLGEVQDIFRRACKKKVPYNVFQNAHKETVFLDVSRINSYSILKYFANQYWRDDTFVEEVSVGIAKLSGLPMEDILDGHTLGDMDGLKNFFLAEEHNQQPKSPVFDRSVIYVGIDMKGRLLGHSYPITIVSNHDFLVMALTLSPNLTFMQVYYKNLDKNNLHKIYVNRIGGCTELTDDEVDALNRVVVTLGRRLGTGYVVSKNKEHLRDVLQDAQNYHS